MPDADARYGGGSARSGAAAAGMAPKCAVVGADAVPLPTTLAVEVNTDTCGGGATSGSAAMMAWRARSAALGAFL